MSKITSNKDAFPRVKPSLSWLAQAVRESALELNASMSTEQDTDSTQLKVTFIPRSRETNPSLIVALRRSYSELPSLTNRRIG